MRSNTGMSARDQSIRQVVDRYATQLEGQLRRNASMLDKLERYCGKEARLYDSQKMDHYDSDKIWSGLEGVISRQCSFNSMSPYTLRYYDLDRNRWLEQYIVAGKIRSMK